MTLQPATTATALTTPSLRRRMVCWLYEGLLLLGVTFVGGIVLGSVGVLFGTPLPPHALQALLFVVLAMYFATFGYRGQTLAMKTWQIRVVDRWGRPLTRLRALTRYALAWLWLLPPLAVGKAYGLPLTEVTVLTVGWVAVWALLSRFHPQRQFVHDWLAGTRLVHAPRNTAPMAAA